MSAAAAAEHKQRGNALFAEKRFAEAVECYTRALEHEESEILLSNRAFAHLKCESFGSALADATRAIELNPSFVKAYYRRGTAYLALTRYKEAVRDFRQVVRLIPNDQDARAKLKEAESILKRVAFEEAIAHENSRPVSEQIDFSTLTVGADYTGPRMEDWKITPEFVMEMIRYFKEQKLIHRAYAYRILVEAITILRVTPNIQHVQIPEGGHFTVCGDVHGQFYDLVNIFELNGYPSPSNPYLFNGDFVDRGSFSVECMLTLFAFKWLYPDHMFLSRGNHESKNLTQMYGFAGEVKHKYEERLLLLSYEAFQALPLGTLIGNKVLCVHGGLFSNDGVTLADIQKVNRFCEIPDTGIMCEMLWSDPQPFTGRSPSKRGVAVQFGPDVTQRFLDENGLSMLVRSHEVKDEGYEIECGGRLVTVFSAPNYCDQLNNKGAFIRFDHALKPMYRSFTAVPHPNVRAMQYAGSAMMGMM